LAYFEVGYYITENYHRDYRCLNPDLNDRAEMAGSEAEYSAFGWDTLDIVPVSHAEFLDPSRVWGGQDFDYVDSHQITWASGHGWSDVHQVKLTMATYEDALDSCDVTPGIHMKLGQPTIHNKWFHVFTCQSMQVEHDAWQAWRTVFAGVHQITGFHGYSWSGSPLPARYAAFAHNSHYTAIAVNWVAQLYVSDNWQYPPGSGTYVDQCPVAYTGRDSLDEASSLLTNEHYPIPGQPGVGYRDEYSPTYWKRRYVLGCDPAGGQAM
jgi:hypothetical protein